MLLVFAPPPPPGPTMPLAHPLPEASPVPKRGGEALRELVRKIPGAIVPVEDSLPQLLSGLPGSLELLKGRLRLQRKGLDPGAPSSPWWTDTSTLRSGGNVVHRIYTLGGVGF